MDTAITRIIFLLLVCHHPSHITVYTAAHAKHSALEHPTHQLPCLARHNNVWADAHGATGRSRSCSLLSTAATITIRKGQAGVGAATAGGSVMLSIVKMEQQPLNQLTATNQSDNCKMISKDEHSTCNDQRRIS